MKRNPAVRLRYYQLYVTLVGSFRAGRAREDQLNSPVSFVGGVCYASTDYCGSHLRNERYDAIIHCRDAKCVTSPYNIFGSATCVHNLRTEVNANTHTAIRT